MAVTTVLVGACLLAGHALADTVPIPPLPGVTVPAPPVVVPTPPVVVPPPVVVKPPTIPELPQPSLPAPSPVAATSSTSAVPGVPAAPSGSSPVTGSTLGGAFASSPSSGSASASYAARSPSSASAGGPGSERTRVERFRSSRPWIATSGPKRLRMTTLIFVLPRAARVVFVVEQVSPVCRVAAHFAVNGHAGLNRVRFPRPTSNLRLDPGTYRITARTRAGHVVQRVTIVVVDSRAPTRDQIAAARTSNVCTVASRLAAATSSSTGASNASAFTAAAGQPSASGLSAGSNGHAGAVLASTVEKAARAVRPVLVALLALAIVLLAIASLPRVATPESRANDLLARHRMEIAGLGAAAFVAVVIAFLLG